MEDRNDIYQDNIAKMVRRFKDERSEWEKRLEKEQKVNAGLIKELEEHKSNSEKESQQLHNEIKELENTLKKAELQRTYHEEELDKRKQDFTTILEDQAAKIKIMEDKMVEAVKEMSKKMAKKELQWASKFSAAQSEIRSLVYKKSEADIYYKSQTLVNALKSLQKGLSNKLADIDSDLDKDANDLWDDCDVF